LSVGDIEVSFIGTVGRGAFVEPNIIAAAE